MGGQALDKEACDMLNELQTQLSVVLDELSAMYSKSLEPTIRKCCDDVSKLLQSVKGSSQLTPNNQKQVQGEADSVINPLIDELHNILSQFAKLCDKTVLKRLLKVHFGNLLTKLKKLYFKTE